MLVFYAKSDLIAKLAKNPKATLEPWEIECLKVFDFILRSGSGLCDTVDGVKNKAIWSIPNTMLTPLLTAINNAKLDYPEKKGLPEINVKDYEAIRKKASGAWFGGRTRKLRRRRTKKGKLRKRKTKQRKLRKR